MKPNSISTLLIFFCIPSLSFAFFCPTNFNQINVGDSTDQVKQQCGAPDAQEVKDAEVNVPQEWSYYVPQTVATDTAEQGQGTLKTSVTFDATGKAINISVNGIGVGSSTICGTPIQLGSTQDQIKAACGKPAFVNKQQPDNPSPSLGTPPPPSKITIFLYFTNPPVSLKFQDGKLVGKT